MPPVQAIRYPPPSTNPPMIGLAGVGTVGGAGGGGGGAFLGVELMVWVSAVGDRGCDKEGSKGTHSIAKS